MSAAGETATGAGSACRDCLARSWLLERLASHLDPVRARIAELLELEEPEVLIAAVGGAHARSLTDAYRRFDAVGARAAAAGAGLGLICRCDAGYPVRLRDLSSPPSVLHVAGGAGRLLELAARDAVAIVGSRRASAYGLDVAGRLAQDLSRSDVTVVSGMALGIDSSAHAGALSGGGSTVAVLPAGAQHAYPRSKRSLHARITAAGVAICELPGTRGQVRRWMFPARNRIIAALAAMTVVVEAGTESGALLTAGWARELGRPVGAVPGRVTNRAASGSNALLAGGAHLIRDAQDVLDHLYGIGERPVAPQTRPCLPDDLVAVLTAIEQGRDTAGALEQTGFATDRLLAALTSLELAGYVRRAPGGRFIVTA